MKMLDTVISLGWGALAFSREKAEKTIKGIISKGKSGGENSRNLILSLKERGAKERVAFKENLSETIEDLLKRSNFISKTEFRELENRLQSLEEFLKKHGGGISPDDESKGS